MIRGYKQLARELDGIYTLGSLRVLDSTGRLPLTRQWHEGNRVWDEVEVHQLRETKLHQGDFCSSTVAKCQKGSTA